MASVQANADTAGPGHLSSNITREQVQRVFQVRTFTTLPIAPLIIARLHESD